MKTFATFLMLITSLTLPPVSKGTQATSDAYWCGCVDSITSVFVSDQKRNYFFSGRGVIGKHENYKTYTFGKYNIKIGAHNYPLTDQEIKAHDFELRMLYFAADINRSICITTFTTGIAKQKVKTINVRNMNCGHHVGE